MSEKKPSAVPKLLKSASAAASGKQSSKVSQIFSPRLKLTPNRNSHSAKSQPSTHGKSLFHNNTPVKASNLNESTQITNDLASNVLDKLIRIEDTHKKSVHKPVSPDFNSSNQSPASSQKRRRLYNPHTFNIDSAFDVSTSTANQKKEKDSLVSSDATTNSSSLTNKSSVNKDSLVTSDATTASSGCTDQSSLDKDSYGSNKSIPGGQNPNLKKTLSDSNKSPSIILNNNSNQTNLSPNFQNNSVNLINFERFL
jgi:hypothetical protein